VREQLGALLLELKRPRDALIAYQAALQIYPARFRGLYGAGLAAERIGNAELARDYFGKLAAQSTAADASRTELAHARAYLGEIPSSH
jgi:tetratricopeptide (TPR) repeat protein